MSVNHYHSRPPIGVVDIFAGPGGLGEGFSSFVPPGSDRSAFRILVSAEKEANAHRTLTLRAFFRRFGRPSDVPDDYYRIVRGEMKAADLRGANAREWQEAEREALLLELGPESGRLHAEIGNRVKRDEPWVLVGGPPCQAYSLVGRARNKGNQDYVPEDDHRHFLYREYLQILSRFAPPIFVMENVKGILTARIDGRKIFPDILRDLRDPGKAVSGRSNGIYDIYPLSANAVGGPYQPSEPDQNLSRFLVKTEELGMPQARHRVILLGVRRGMGLREPLSLVGREAIAVGKVIRDLPRIRSALSKRDSQTAWLDEVERQRRIVLSALSRRQDLVDVADVIKSVEFIDKAERSSKRPSDLRVSLAYAEWYRDPRLGVTLNHDSRGHMASDLGRYMFCAGYSKANGGRSPTTAEFPSKLAADHRSWESGNFANRFRVQAISSSSATIVSHISKMVITSSIQT